MKLQRLLGLIIISSQLYATSRFLSPLTIQQGYSHYDLDPVKPNKTVDILLWTALFQRTAFESFSRCANSPLCAEEETTRCTVPLSKLFFGKSDFKGEEAFFGGTLVGVPDVDPALINSIISPRVNFSESGCVLGVNVQTVFGKDKRLRGGFRSNIPFSAVTFTCNCCGLEEPVNCQDLIAGIPAIKFFKNHGVLIQTETVAGQGDWAMDVYFGYGPTRAFFDGVVGIVFPTTVKSRNVTHPLEKAPGQGHFRGKIGIEGGCQPTDWMAIKGDASYTRAMTKRRNQPAPFVGATIKNIGPCVLADITWNAGVIHCDVTLYHPDEHKLTATIGYEFYVKGHDMIQLTQDMAVDFLCRTEPLDACILQAKTTTYTNKIYGSIFQRIKCGEFFLGGSQVFAGKNAMKESEWHLGLNIYF